MAELKQIWDRLAFSADLPQNELAAYARGLCGAGLIPHGRDAEATPEATAWLILTVLCGPEPKRTVERAQEVANFRNYEDGQRELGRLGQQLTYMKQSGLAR
jgi:hypothetical protein